MLALKGFQNLSAFTPCRCIHASVVACKSRVAGKTRTTRNRSQPLTYEQAYLPHHIGHLKNWNSWNTSTTLDGKRAGETAVEDMFIRRFMDCTWHRLFVSEIIIKRQFNIIRIAGIIHQAIIPRKIYFLIGYSEELLSNWLQCPVKLELQTVADKKDVIYKYI